MKKILSIILAFVVTLSLLACAPVDNSVHVNVEDSGELSDSKFGKSALVEIGDDLWYDSTTGIVYWWNGMLESYDYKSDTVPSPYYAPNGLPYRYNPETNTFEEIDIYG